MAKKKPTKKAAPKRAKPKAAKTPGAMAAVVVVPDPFAQIEDTRKRLFLLAYADRGTVQRAAYIAGVDRTSHYHWLKGDAAYKEAFRDAQRIYREKLEEEADRRAVEGVPKLKFFKGELILIPCDPGDPLGRCLAKTDDGREIWAKPYVEHEYSDVLLMFRLKRLDANYKDRVDVKAKTHTTVKIAPEQGRGAMYAAFLKSLVKRSTCPN